MARVTVEDCLEHEENRFALCILAAKRTRQLNRGVPALVESKNRAAVTSLRRDRGGTGQVLARRARPGRRAHRREQSTRRRPRRLDSRTPRRKRLRAASALTFRKTLDVRAFIARALSSARADRLGAEFGANAGAGVEARRADAGGGGGREWRRTFRLAMSRSTSSLTMATPSARPLNSRSKSWRLIVACAS